MEQVILIPGGGTCCLLTAGASLSSMSQSASAEPWALDQLMLRAGLVKVVTDKHKSQPVVFSIGPDAFIKGSIDKGSVKGKANLAYFAGQLSEFLKDANIVIYCVCCPLEHGVNFRPAFKLLNDLKFSNQKLPIV